MGWKAVLRMYIILPVHLLLAIALPVYLGFTLIIALTSLNPLDVALPSYLPPMFIMLSISLALGRLLL